MAEKSVFISKTEFPCGISGRADSGDFFGKSCVSRSNLKCDES